MRLNLIIDDYSMDLDVEERYLTAANEVYTRMDADMDGGWRIGREWVERPGRLQRCQVAADRLLAAIEGHNETQAMLMAGYILTRMPAVRRVVLNTSGEVELNRLFDADGKPLG